MTDLPPPYTSPPTYHRGAGKEHQIYYMKRQGNYLSDEFCLIYIEREDFDIHIRSGRWHFDSWSRCDSFIARIEDVYDHMGWGPIRFPIHPGKELTPDIEYYFLAMKMK